ncbi:unnamed protein product, partial [Rotaria sp. Silwood2]
MIAKAVSRAFTDAPELLSRFQIKGVLDENSIT